MEPTILIADSLGITRGLLQLLDEVDDDTDARAHVLRACLESLESKLVEASRGIEPEVTS